MDLSPGTMELELCDSCERLISQVPNCYGGDDDTLNIPLIHAGHIFEATNNCPLCRLILLNYGEGEHRSLPVKDVIACCSVRPGDFGSVSLLHINWEYGTRCPSRLNVWAEPGKGNPEFS
jgi:hypothetical protein